MDQQTINCLVQHIEECDKIISKEITYYKYVYETKKLWKTLNTLRDIKLKIMNNLRW